MVTATSEIYPDRHPLSLHAALPISDTARQRLQQPELRHRAGQLDVAHALAANLRKRDLDAALLADDAAVLHALVLAAQALVVIDRTEDARAEQAVQFRIDGTEDDGIRPLDLAVGPGPEDRKITRLNTRH